MTAAVKRPQLEEKSWNRRCVTAADAINGLHDEN